MSSPHAASKVSRSDSHFEALGRISEHHSFIENSGGSTILALFIVGIHGTAMEKFNVVLWDDSWHAKSWNGGHEELLTGFPSWEHAAAAARQHCDGATQRYRIEQEDSD